MKKIPIFFPNPWAVRCRECKASTAGTLYQVCVTIQEKAGYLLMSPLVQSACNFKALT